ncbi:hypothetical protein [Ectobacillus ponti]|uniref:Uncharacterized protein n=1 Tax=Ectobacillus ponti TaxID=2961894 RepID=A0AA42BRM3_9BACI|nr:hypothetical protein [Ectobacillus ponti]MCP8970541.1 hypothetical protein [Ectobacillus ponti]
MTREPYSLEMQRGLVTFLRVTIDVQRQQRFFEGSLQQMGFKTEGMQEVLQKAEEILQQMEKEAAVLQAAIREQERYVKERQQDAKLYRNMMKTHRDVEDIAEYRGKHEAADDAAEAAALVLEVLKGVPYGK